MEILRIISRIITGLVFIFSGFVKAVDPLGSTYKFTDYFNALGFDFLSPFALPLAILLPATEIVLGITLLFGYRMKVASWVLIVFMSFFTILTLIIALTNPVTDCGCFGDALVITNWETFFKNIILFFFALIIFIYRKNYRQIRGPVTEWSILFVFFLLSVWFSIFNYNHLPLLDFRPFSKGSNIVKGMEIPEGVPQDVYDTKLIYKNKTTGKNQVFSIETIPDASLWEFVSSESKLITKGYEPPIHDFSIIAPNEQEITDLVLQHPGYTFLLVSYNLNLADNKALINADKFFKISQVLEDLDFYALTASTSEDAFRIKDSLKLSYDFCSVDEIVLKTIIRSNPGMVLLKNGTVIGKWHFNDFPDVYELGTELGFLVRTFPLSPGVNLNSLKVPPVGSRPDKFRTTLTYLNIFDNHTDTFAVDMIPPERNWKFVSSNSEIIQRGFVLPLSDFNIITPDGVEISDNILISQNNTFLVIASDPQNIKRELLDRINMLTPLTGNTPAVFYGLSSLKSDQLKNFTESFVSPVIFCTTPSTFIEKVAGTGITLVWLQKGKVAGVWKDDEIPLPENFERILLNPAEAPVFETNVLTYIFRSERFIREKQTIYLFILGFMVVSLMIRVFLEDPFLKRK